MGQQHYLVIIAILGMLFVSGCVQQLVTPPQTEEKITNQCITELSVFENKFGISRESIKVLDSECSTCSPWYTPQVATFSATIEKDGKKYDLFFSDECTRHSGPFLKYKVASEENRELYNQMKNKICADFSHWRSYLQECWDEDRNIPTIEEFTSCVNNYSKFIEEDIVKIDEDWEYCSTEGWKRCKEWNSCEPSGPTQTSLCNSEYCKMSCLMVYSKERIQKKFTEVCETQDKIENGKYVFTFEVPNDADGIISTNFLK